MKLLHIDYGGAAVEVSPQECALLARGCAAIREDVSSYENPCALFLVDAMAAGLRAAGTAAQAQARMSHEAMRALADDLREMGMA